MPVFRFPFREGGRLVRKSSFNFYYLYFMKATLYLIPSTLGAEEADLYLPPAVVQRLHSLDLFFAENIRTARRFLKSTGFTGDISSLTFLEMSEHTTVREAEELLHVLMERGEAGLLSEAGLPGVADPGNILVSLCHRHGVRVVPLPGPSSIFLALMASGLNGQHFTFLGYLPKERSARIRAIREMEHRVQRTGASQIFMETPYRNDHLLEDLLKSCSEETLLCVAASLTTAREFVLTQSIGAWRKSGYRPGKQPVMFIIGKEG